MLAFEVEIDGEKAFLAGVEDWHLLTFHLNAMREQDSLACSDYDLDLHMGGMTVSDEHGVAHHLRWGGELPLALGSVVTIKIVETDSPDPLVRRYRSDREVQECAFTPEEMRQMRYDDYLAYKAEFEPDA